jgi:hypothetical protein
MVIGHLDHACPMSGECGLCLLGTNQLDTSSHMRLSSDDHHGQPASRADGSFAYICVCVQGGVR